MIKPILNVPDDIPKTFVAGWNSKNIDLLVSVFEEDAEFVNVVGLWWHDRKSIRKAHDYGLKVIFKDTDLEIRESRVKYVREDVAVVHVRLRLVGQTSFHGQRAYPRQTIFSFFVHKKEQEWRCTAAHNTDIVPGKETHLADEAGKVSPVDYRSNPSSG